MMCSFKYHKIHLPYCVFYPTTEIASDALKGRVFEVSLADLQNDEVAFRKFRLVVEDVQGKNCLTNFHGMNLTRDKYCSMVKKWQVRAMETLCYVCAKYIRNTVPLINVSGREIFGKTGVK